MARERTEVQTIAPALQTLIESSHVPAVSYAYVEPSKESEQAFASTTVTLGKKIATESGEVDEQTQFPASSLSKVVFTYLVLQLVREKQIDLDEPLHSILPYERFLVDGKYPEKAKLLTARHVLSHTTGLPNWGPSLSSPLKFDTESALGEGYSYSGEAILYLQKVIEAKMSKDLETLAREFVFTPLGMNRSTFLPQAADDTNVVAVHTTLEKPAPIYVGDPPDNAAGSLLTTAHDFAKLMTAWLQNMNDPIIQQAFESSNAYIPGKTCGLGWHIYKDEDKVIAYQYGENPNTRSFIAINLTDKKAAVFFTNSENGMSIANQIFNSPDLPSIANLQEILKQKHYSQSDEPGWKETLNGMIAVDQNRLEEARRHFEQALELAPEDKSKQQRLEWFNMAHQPPPDVAAFSQPLEAFVGKYTNPHEQIEISARDGNLIYKQQFSDEIKLVRVSDTDFLDEKGRAFKISFNRDQVNILFVEGYEKSFVPIPQDSASLEAARKVNQQYRDTLGDIKTTGAPASEAIGIEENQTHSPFKITPTPSGDE